MLQSVGLQRVGHGLMTNQQQIEQVQGKEHGLAHYGGGHLCPLCLLGPSPEVLQSWTESTL